MFIPYLIFIQNHKVFLVLIHNVREKLRVSEAVRQNDEGELSVYAKEILRLLVSARISLWFRCQGVICVLVRLYVFAEIYDLTDQAISYPVEDYVLLEHLNVGLNDSFIEDLETFNLDEIQSK